MTNRDIKKFMIYLGYKFVTIERTDSAKESDWQKKNRKWLKSVGIDSVGDYFILKEKNEFHWMVFEEKWSKIIDLKNDWNWLMKVVKKAEIKYISTDKKKTFQRCCEIVLNKKKQ